MTAKAQCCRSNRLVCTKKPNHQHSLCTCMDRRCFFLKKFFFCLENPCLFWLQRLWFCLKRLWFSLRRMRFCPQETEVLSHAVLRIQIRPNQYIFPDPVLPSCIGIRIRIRPINSKNPSFPRNFLEVLTVKTSDDMKTRRRSLKRLQFCLKMWWFLL